tara:strand:+ start:170 stop:340 length:171 start_codon:yes stop_codon:yes gene_type:complete
MEYRITYEKRMQSGELFEEVTTTVNIVAHNLVEATTWALSNAPENERVKAIDGVPA